jgi:hypothetical protein
MIGFIGTSITITINYNSSQIITKTRTIPYWITSAFSSTVTNDERRTPCDWNTELRYESQWLNSLNLLPGDPNIQGVHFAIFRRPEHLIGRHWYLPANSMTFILWSTDQWVSQCYVTECYRSFYCALFCVFMTLWVNVLSACALNTRYITISNCSSVIFFIHYHGDVLTETYSGMFTNKRVLASRCLAIDCSGFQDSCHSIYYLFRQLFCYCDI